MKIKAKWEISYTNGCVTFDLEELDCKSEQEWNELSEFEKGAIIQDAIDDLPESPSKILSNYYTE